jgi:hypothetical protein
MKKLFSIVRTFAEKLFLSLHTTVICLVILCVLVLWGTFYQIDNGIYAAKARFFSSWIVLIWGIVPFPGVRLAVFVLILNQLSMLAFRQKWRFEKAGLIITHVGILILLIGGGIISYTARESFLMLWEGESSNESSLYHSWEIAAWAQDAHTGARSLAVYGTDTMATGQKYPVAFANGVFTLEGLYKNSMALASARGDTSSRGSTAIDSLEPQRPASDPSENVPGAVLTFSKGGAAPEKVLLYAANPEPSFAANNADTVWFALRQKRVPLPITVTLKDFVKEDYAGTSMARQFKSTVHVAGSDIDREVVVSMNKPFRYRHYTLYQSSYSQSGKRESSTFAVVENRGKSLPYVAGLFMAVGLVLHFCLKLVAHIRKQEAA